MATEETASSTSISSPLPSLLQQQQQQEEDDSYNKWRLQQGQLLQIRSTFLSEALAQKFGVPLTTMKQVSTLDSDRTAELVDWDCALSTVRHPKSCLYCFDAQPGSKVVAPVGTTQYITLSALNRLRRTDPSKVEPMWHGNYAILRAWFTDDDLSVFSLFPYAGWRGFLVSSVLLHGNVLRASLWTVTTLATMSLIRPVWSKLINRVLVGGLFWSFYDTWSKVFHAAFPLKLLLGQMLIKTITNKFLALEDWVRNYVVEWECQILEECVPITVWDEDEEDDEDCY